MATYDDALEIYNEAISSAQEKSDQAKSEIETGISNELNELNNVLAETKALYDDLLSRAPTGAERANLALGPVRGIIDQVVTNVIDIGQRQGYGSQGVKSLISNFTRTALPLASEGVREAFGYRAGLEERKIALSSDIGVRKASTEGRKGELLAGLSSDLGRTISTIKSNMASTKAKQASEETQIAQRNKELENEYKIATLRYQNPQSVIKSGEDLGVQLDPNKVSGGSYGGFSNAGDYANYLYGLAEKEESRLPGANTQQKAIAGIYSNASEYRELARKAIRNASR